MHRISLIVSHTDTTISSFIRLITGSHFNHCSIMLDMDKTKIYSYARKYEAFFFPGSFKHETPDMLKTDGVLDAEIYTFDVTDEQFMKVTEYIHTLENSFTPYNYLIAALLPLRVKRNAVRSHTCSSFSAYALELSGCVDLEKHYSLYSPKAMRELMVRKYHNNLTDDTSIDF
ncbi:MAG: hypothetical protein MJ171_03120 [Clostridia bacterium]|nr:hypothetical protein [Clostridia bacterium]